MGACRQSSKVHLELGWRYSNGRTWLSASQGIAQSINGFEAVVRIYQNAELKPMCTLIVPLEAQAT